MEISKNAIYSYLCPKSIKRISSQNGFHCGIEMIFKRKMEGNLKSSPCRGTGKLAMSLPSGERAACGAVSEVFSVWERW